MNNRKRMIIRAMFLLSGWHRNNRFAWLTFGKWSAKRLAEQWKRWGQKNREEII